MNAHAAGDARSDRTAHPVEAAALEPPPATGGGLTRVLRVREGLAIIVGSIIGVGILRTPGIIATYLGDPWSILGVWLLGGIVAILSTLLLAEMAAALPGAGGKYVYAREAFGPVAGFVAGWSELAVGRAFSAAAKAVVIAEYLILLTGRGSLRIIAVAVILAFAFLHMGGLKVGTVFQTVTTIIKVAVLLGITAAGLWAGDARGFAAGASATAATGGLLGFAVSYQLAAYACYGWEDAAKMAEEVRDPGRALPRILLGGSVIVAVLYLLINVAFLSALTPAEMARSPLVAQDAVAWVFGKTTGTLMVVAGLLIVMSTLNVNFLGMPRVAFALSRDRMGPSLFTRVGTRGTPIPALVFSTLLILGLTVTGAFEFLVRFLMLVSISVDLMVFLGFFRLRRVRPELERPLRVPGYPWIPLFTVVLYVGILAVIVATQPQLAFGAGLILASLTVAGLLRVRRVGTVAAGEGRAVE